MNLRRSPLLHAKQLGVLLVLAMSFSACGALSGAVSSDDASSTDTTISSSPSEEEPSTDSSDSSPSDNPPDGLASVGTVAYEDSILALSETSIGEVSTGQIRVVSTVEGTESGGELVSEAAFDYTQNRHLTKIDMSGATLAGQTADQQAMAAEPTTIITIGSDAFVAGGFATMVGADSGMWLQADTPEARSYLSDMAETFGSVDALFENYRGHDLLITELGAATYDGVETTGYEIFSTTTKPTTTEVWISEDGLIRHFEFPSTETDPDTDETITTVTVGDLFGYGEPVSIDAPPSDLVTHSPGF